VAAATLRGCGLSEERIVTYWAVTATLVFLFPPSLALAEVPDAIAAPGASEILKVHAEGAQIYECKTGKDGKLHWEFREPIASLIVDGKTVGRHYAGPTWELSDGSAVTGKVSARAPGAAANDVPLLKLDAASHRGNGQLSSASIIQRLNTKGGVAEGDCSSAGALLSSPYSSDYVFLK
jgi:hypothetical protein